MPVHLCMEMFLETFWKLSQRGNEEDPAGLLAASLQ